MKRLLIRACLTAVALAGAEAACYAQQQLPSRPDLPEELLPAGVIEGKVYLPSGHSIDGNVRIVLRNKQTTLNTLYTNKNGEFRFVELREGIYYIEVTPDTEIYDKVTQEIWLKRAQHLGVSIYLPVKREESVRVLDSRTISVKELSQKVPSAARKEYERASKLSRKGRIQEAVTHLKRAIAIAPDYLMALNDLGVQYLKLRRLDDAAEQFHSAMQKDPKYFSPRHNLGLVLVEQAKYLEAIDLFRQALALDSSHPATHLWLGIALIEVHESNEAERELLRARLLGGTDYSIAQFYMAQILINRNQREEALEALESYLEESPAGEKHREARSLIERLRK